MPKMQETRLTFIRRILCILFAMLMIFSVCFEVLESGHECSGEDCLTCSIIQILVQNIKLLGLVFAALAICSRKISRKRNGFVCLKNQFDMANTLLVQKTRLND